MATTSAVSRAFKFFVGQLRFSTTNQLLRNHFEQYGKVRDVHIIYNLQTGYPSGFGFVTMESEEDVASILQNKFHKLEDEHSIQVARVKGDSSPPPPPPPSDDNPMY